jgi:hypothetical protein
MIESMLSSFAIFPYSLESLAKEWSSWEAR